MSDLKHVIASCYLNEKKSDDEIVYFTPFWLHVIKGKKHWRFENENILDVKIAHHKIVGALAIGGIISCFSIVMISARMLDPYLLLTCLVIGLFLIYYGVMGSSVVMVSEKNDNTVIYLNETQEPLQHFINFYKNYINPNTNVMRIFHIAFLRDWEQNENYYSHASLKNEGFIHASDLNQIMPSFEKHFPKEGEFVLLEINISELESKLEYEFVIEQNTSFPHIFGIINKSAVINTYAFQELGGLLHILKRL